MVQTTVFRSVGDRMEATRKRLEADRKRMHERLEAERRQRRKKLESRMKQIGTKAGGLFGPGRPSREPKAPRPGWRDRAVAAVARLRRRARRRIVVCLARLTRWLFSWRTPPRALTPPSQGPYR